MHFQFLMSPLAKTGVTRRPKLKNVFFTDGQLINSNLDEPLVFQTDATVSEPPPDYSSKVIPVMSDRLVHALKEAGVDNLQGFKAELVNKQTKETWTGYQAVNIIGLVSCADMKNSKYEKMGGGLYVFDELVIDPDRTHGFYFFRLAESPSTIIAHKVVGDYLYGGKCDKMTGFRFWPAHLEGVEALRNASRT